ncbi:hypothetical protein L198_08074 [Cryptococcus wingfieldii CBS 7118]|uniref:Uncharacterized protein n=1 Tax=Cryptococcus wingfieldii CBS 7118 TaxID=1295528 RepID=A0A1E3HJF8_9TREE|nr:hypothetical protein L198_08074 [Cryptococcus wingfieldii CBS 7118]ODN76478.1 hypothetical protein L198_08074 [Cryptococcus wingfieldii CBS 7118]
MAERVLAGEDESGFTHLASLDASNAINRLLHTYLSRVAGAVIHLEPPTQTWQRRNDLRVRGGGGALPNIIYDLKVYGLDDKNMYVVQGGKPRDTEWLEWVQGRCVAWLGKRDEEVVSHQPRIYAGGGAVPPPRSFCGRFDGRGDGNGREELEEVQGEGGLARIAV